MIRGGWQPGSAGAAEWRHNDLDLVALLSMPRSGWQRVQVVGAKARGDVSEVPAAELPSNGATRLPDHVTHLAATCAPNGPFKWNVANGAGRQLTADVPVDILTFHARGATTLTTDFRIEDLGIGEADARAVLLDGWLHALVREALGTDSVEVGPTRTSDDPAPNADEVAERIVKILRERGWEASRLGPDVRVTLADLASFEQVQVELGTDRLRLTLPLAEFEENSESSFAAALLVAEVAHEQLPLTRIVCRVEGTRSLVAEVDLGGIAIRNHVTTPDFATLDSPWTDAALTSLTECAQGFAEEVRALRDEALSSIVLEGARRRSEGRLSNKEVLNGGR